MTTGRRESPPSIGLTGSIGAGKSAALEAFARHGAAVLESDRIVHALYDRADVRDAVSERLGSAVRRVDGSIDRGRVAELVFAEPELRQWLEDLIHPLVEEALIVWRDEQSALVPAPVALVHEVPLLFETGAAERYDRTLVIAAPDPVRRARVAARGALEGLERREQRLLPEAEKIALADDVIVNDGDLAALDRAVATYLAAL